VYSEAPRDGTDDPYRANGSLDMSNKTDIDAVDVVGSEGPKTFTTISGIEFKIKPISQNAIRQLNLSRKVPVVPTFKVPVLGGGFEDMPYDETYVKEHEEDPEIVEKWLNYQIAVETELMDYSNRLGRMVILMGTEIDVPGIESDWQKEQEYLGMTPPAEGPERKVYYMLNAVLTDDRDGGSLTGEVLALGRVDMESAQRVRDSFRIEQTRKAISEPDEIEQRMESEPVVQ